jgi:serine/threonine protein kinase
MSVKDAKPGSYKPKCGKCGQRFALTLSADPSASPVVGPLDHPVAPSPAASAPTRVDDHEATLPHAAAPQAAADPPQTDATLPMHARATQFDSAPSHSTRSDRADATQPDSARLPAGHPAASTLAASSPPDSAPSPSASAPGAIPEKIGGYRILKQLGRGAMGAVYLARQISLDRDVALKTIQSQWATHPTFVARFTREAYAAAQLTHHNVVQIYDLGVDGPTNYFSMEYVRGSTLDELIKRQGKLDAEVAVGYVLQAARGLRFAHGQGMIHRDVKPANIMLNDQGVVKVADLGLVKFPGDTTDDPAENAESSGDRAATSGSPGKSKQPDRGIHDASTLSASRADVTLQHVAMGTPAYMAPEQADNAAGVDHRADIYSLGCTLYVLLTGKPPFEGSTAMEVITKHRTEPVVRPDAVVRHVSKQLADITLKMVAKEPQQRYQNLDDVIRDLEQYLGISSHGVFSPTEQHVQIVERCQQQFHSAPLTRVRAFLPSVLFATCLALSVVLFFVRWWLGGAMLGIAVMTTAFYFLWSGVQDRGELFARFRALLFTAHWSDWLTWAGGGLIVLVGLWLTGWLLPWLGAAVLSIGLAGGFYLGVDRRLASQRRPAVEEMESLLKSLRLKGLEEAALRQFVAKYSPEQWEELFETLFGYAAKIEARQALRNAEQRGKRRAFRAWRDPLILWMENRTRAAKEEKDRKYLQQVEERNLKSQGVSADQAKLQAQQMAEVIVDAAVETRMATQTPSALALEANPAAVASRKREKVRRMLAEARGGKYKSRRPSLRGAATAPIALLLGGKVRFLLGCLVLALFALWFQQNDLAASVDLSEVKSIGNTDDLLSSGKKLLDAKPRHEPLKLPLIGSLFNGFAPCVAGLTLILLGVFPGRKMSLFALPAATIMLVGPAWFTLDSWLAIGGGLAIAVVGLFFGRSAKA